MSVRRITVPQSSRKSLVNFHILPDRLWTDPIAERTAVNGKGSDSMEFWWLLGGAVILSAVLMIRNKDRMPWRSAKPTERLGPRSDVDRVEGDQAELWPDRTGPQTKKELGARAAGHEGPLSPGASLAEEKSQAEYLTWQYVSADAKQTDGEAKLEPGVSGAPGQHVREGGHHRSATAPTKRSDASDPIAYAPVPGPNHVFPDGGDRLPPDNRS